MSTPLPWIDPDTFDEEISNITYRRSGLRAEGTFGAEETRGSLVGLALSGGGIRSATFGLGVLEALKVQDRLKQLDYLSTVSGGGYIGAWLSANCKRSADRRAAIAENKVPEAVRSNDDHMTAYAAAAGDWLDKGISWKESIAHLRRYSNYLSPELGIFRADSWSMIATWLRNTMLVQFTVFMAIAVLLLLPRLLLAPFEQWPGVGDARWLTVIMFDLAVAGIAANHWRLTQRAPLPFLQADKWPAGLAGALLCIGAVWFICRVFGFSPFDVSPIDWPIALLAAIPAVLTGFFLLPVGVRLSAWLMPRAAAIFPSWMTKLEPKHVDYGQGLVQALIVVPIMITSCLLAAVLWGLATTSTEIQQLDSYGKLLMHGARYWPFPLAISFVSLWLLSYFSRDPGKRSVWTAIWAPIPALAALHAMMSGVMLLMHNWADMPGHPQVRQATLYALVWAPPLILYSFSLTIVILIGMMGRESTEGVREWWARLGAWFFIYGAAWMLFTVASVFGPLWVLALLDDEAGWWKGASAVGGWIATTLAGLLAGNAGESDGSKGQEEKKTGMARALNVIAIVGPYVFAIGLVLAIATVLHLILMLASVEACCTLGGAHKLYWFYMSQAPALAVLLMLAGSAAVTLLLALRVDINVFSLNSFYRGRLTRCYLGAARFAPQERDPHRFTLFDDQDDLPLSALGGNAHRKDDAGKTMAPGPLHIINCALNLGGSSDLSLHSRHAASFVLTPYRIGTGYYARTETGCYEPLGYRPIDQYCGDEPQPTLGQAISISGAAASPNMGYHTSPMVAFMLTIFNIRLGWWFPNPRLAHISRPGPTFSMRYLLKELFGGADEKSNYLMVSDGGHFENLAAYELIRRKCRVVIVSDAECDRRYQFNGLGSLIRMCDVDFDVKIEIDVRPILGDAKSRWATQRFAIGRIIYGQGLPDGVLIYLKASLTGKEDSAVQQYKACHEHFPHESTGDQFYGEDQFESYRRLGYDIAFSLFKNAASQPDLVAAADALLKDYPGTAAQAVPKVRRQWPAAQG